MRAAVFAALVALCALAVALRSRALEGFASLSEFAIPDLRTHFGPTGAPGEDRPNLVGPLPTFFPQVPGVEGTLKPDSGLRTLRRKDGSKCTCPRPHPFDFRDVRRDTVCVKETSQAFSSACAARCMGFRDDELYACKPRQALYRVG